MKGGKLVIILPFLTLSILWSGIASAGCFDCHTELEKKAKGPGGHKPVREGHCTTCHNPHTSDHPHLLRKEPGELCGDCHETKRPRVAHLPVEQARCEKCHDPHGSPHPKLLRRTVAETCLGCHKEKEVFTGTVVHSPTRDCSRCHIPHGGEYEALLIAPREKICHRCHKSRDLVTAHGRIKPRGKSCLTCHPPHAGEGKLLGTVSHAPYESEDCLKCHQMTKGKVGPVRARNRSLCLSCHGKLTEGDHLLYSHLQMGKEENVCLGCHSPHRSVKKALLLREQKRICFSCHTDIRQRVLGMAKEHKYRHPNIANCSECHQVHGSNHLDLLKDGGIKTCGACHKRHLNFTHPIGQKAIDPRNKKAMDCTSCHQPMGAPYRFNAPFDHRKDLCIQCHQIET